MLLVDCQAAAEKFDEMKSKKEHAYIVVRISNRKCIVDKEMKKEKFPNEKCTLIKTKMDHIVSYLYRECNHINNMNELNDIDTIIFSRIILQYFQYEGEYRDYLKEMVEDILSNYRDLCCWIIVHWNDKFCFISWVPDFAKARSKMWHASTSQRLKSQCIGLRISYSATDESELSEEGVKEKTKSRY